MSQAKEIGVSQSQQKTMNQTPKTRYKLKLPYLETLALEITSKMRLLNQSYKGLGQQSQKSTKDSQIGQMDKLQNSEKS